MQRLDPKEPKPVQINMVLSSSQKQKLDILSSNRGRSEFVRSLIDEAWAAHVDQSEKEKKNGSR